MGEKFAPSTKILTALLLPSPNQVVSRRGSLETRFGLLIS
jgi:hypothetical protein